MAVPNSGVSVLASLSQRKARVISKREDGKSVRSPSIKQDESAIDPSHIIVVCVTSIAGKDLRIILIK